MISRFLLLALAAAVAGAMAAIYLAYRADLDRARQTVQSGAVVADTAAGAVQYADRGAGVPLLSIHGAGGGFDQGLDNVDGLIGTGFRVIAPSRFGYLKTPVPKDASPAAQADAHAALLDTLGIERVAAIGISAGARSALELAIRHPGKVSALVLIVPGTYAPSSPVMIEPSRGSRLAFFIVNHGGDFAWWAAEKIAPSMLIRFLGVTPALVAAATPEQRSRVLRIVNSVQPLSMRFAGINIDSRPALHDLPLDGITAPTLVISARDDLFNTAPAAEYAAGRIPSAELVIYETGGHLLVGREAETRARVGAFLAATLNP